MARLPGGALIKLSHAMPLHSSSLSTVAEEPSFMYWMFLVYRKLGFFFTIYPSGGALTGGNERK